MKWSILILTQPSRADYLSRLLAGLIPQTVEALGKVEIVVQGFDPAISLGTNRQRMRESVSSEYVSFIDDDDLVVSDYVASILPLLDGVDYVGFTLQQFTDGRREMPTYNSLHYGKWWNDEYGFYRDISHVCPIRRELALKVKMEGNFGEDSRWADSLRSLGVVKTQNLVNPHHAIYEYHYRSQKKDGAQR